MENGLFVIDWCNFLDQIAGTHEKKHMFYFLEIMKVWEFIQNGKLFFIF